MTSVSLTASWHFAGYLLGHPVWERELVSCEGSCEGSWAPAAAAVRTGLRRGATAAGNLLAWSLRVAHGLVLLLGSSLQDLHRWCRATLTRGWRWCSGMEDHLLGQAVIPVQPPGGVPFPAAGTFVIIAKPNLDECDEYFLAAQFTSGDASATPEWVALTTEDEHPHRFVWRLLGLKQAAIEMGGFIMMNSALANRAPMNDVDYPINLICTGEGMPV